MYNFDGNNYARSATIISKLHILSLLMYSWLYNYNIYYKAIVLADITVMNLKGSHN